MEIYFKLKFADNKKSMHENICIALKDMAHECHKFPNGEWPSHLRTGAEISWTRNPLDKISLKEVMNYHHDIWNSFKGRETLYSFIKNEIIRHGKYDYYDDELNYYYKKIIKVLKKLIKFFEGKINKSRKLK